MSTFNHFLHIGYRLSAVALFGLLLGISTALFGQSTSGSITGTARDIDGAMVPDAVVTVTNSEVNLTRETRTGSTAPLGQFFGEYNAARDPRIIQLAAKFIW